MNRAEPLIDVAAAVADGSPVDWDGVERQSDLGARVVARNLGLLERIASVHSALCLFVRPRRIGTSAATGIVGEVCPD